MATPWLTDAGPRGSCGRSIGRVKRMGDQEREVTMVGLKEECIEKT